MPLPGASTSEKSPGGSHPSLQGTKGLALLPHPSAPQPLTGHSVLLLPSEDLRPRPQPICVLTSMVNWSPGSRRLLSASPPVQAPMPVPHQPPTLRAPRGELSNHGPLGGGLWPDQGSPKGAFWCTGLPLPSSRSGLSQARPLQRPSPRPAHAQESPVSPVPVATLPAVAGRLQGPPVSGQPLLLPLTPSHPVAPVWTLCPLCCP